MTSASRPSGAVPTLPPSAASESGCGEGSTMAPLSSPRSQWGTAQGSAWTLAKPASPKARRAQATPTL